MDKYHIYKAQSHPGRPIASATIILDVEIPDTDSKTNLIEWESQANQQAELLEKILIETLPGGVYDRLLARMMARKASLFKVPLLS